MMSDTELAWAAGFFDGEGCTCLRKEYKKNNLGKRYRTISVQMQIVQVRSEPLRRFHNVLGLGSFGGPYTPSGKNSKRYFKWSTAGRKSVCQALILMWPWLSLPKREQAQQVWRSLQQMRSKKSQQLPPLPEKI
jgi:hypothetical protein